MLMWQGPLSGLKLDFSQVLHAYLLLFRLFFSVCRTAGKRDLSPPPTSVRIAYNYKPRLVKETQVCHSIFLSVSGVQLSNHFYQQTAPVLAELNVASFPSHWLFQT